MAAEKKTTVKPVVKAVEAAVKEAASKVEEKMAAAPAEEKKTAPKAEEKAAAPAAEKKPRGRKPGVKNAEKTAAKTASKTAAKKKELTSEMHVQFSGKSYSQEDLVKIAKDVWKYDLKQKAGDLASVELYVKPEENIVYYVMNKEFTGSFYI